MWAKTGHSTDNDPVSAVCQHWERVLAEGEREREKNRERAAPQASGMWIGGCFGIRGFVLPEHLKAVEGDTMQSTFLELQLPECKLIIRGWWLSALWKLALAGFDSPGDCASL